MLFIIISFRLPLCSLRAGKKLECFFLRREIAHLLPFRLDVKIEKFFRHNARQIEARKQSWVPRWCGWRKFRRGAVQRLRAWALLLGNCHFDNSGKTKQYLNGFLMQAQEMSQHGQNCLFANEFACGYSVQQIGDKVCRTKFILANCSCASHVRRVLENGSLRRATTRPIRAPLCSDWLYAEAPG